MEKSTEQNQRNRRKDIKKSRKNEIENNNFKKQRRFTKPKDGFEKINKIDLSKSYQEKKVQI